jgi:hypothetical protein
VPEEEDVAKRGTTKTNSDTTAQTGTSVVTAVASVVFLLPPLFFVVTKGFDFVKIMF